MVSTSEQLAKGTRVKRSSNTKAVRKAILIRLRSKNLRKVRKVRSLFRELHDEGNARRIQRRYLIQRLNTNVQAILARPLKDFARSFEGLPSVADVKTYVNDEFSHQERMKELLDFFVEDSEKDEDAFDTSEEEQEAQRLEDEDSDYDVWVMLYILTISIKTKLCL